MTMPKQDWPRLARYVVSRRVALGYERQLDLVQDTSLGLRTLGSIETGERTRYNRSTLAVLEQALKWELGSIDAVLDGGEPTPSDSRETGFFSGRYPDDLRDDVEHAIWDVREAPEDERWQMITLHRVILERNQRTA